MAPGAELDSLADERRNEVGIEAVGAGVGDEFCPIRLREEQVPVCCGNVRHGLVEEGDPALLHRLQRAGVFPVRGVDLALGQRAPMFGVGAGVDLGGDVFVERGVGEQARLDEVRVVFGEIGGERLERDLLVQP